MASSPKSVEKRRRRITKKISDSCLTYQVLVLILVFFIASAFVIESFLPIANKLSGKKFNKTQESKCPLVPDQQSSVNITTKQLYDEIKFLDEDGGVWKQGFELAYKGGEWDEYNLQVIVVPHSHNDPGWLRTVTEYYNYQSKKIINNIVNSLSQNPGRSFIWEEMSFLQMWWSEASLDQKNLLRRIIANGQLEIVGGGWVMNDEANSHYFAIIDQIIEGNNWLYETFGFIPKNSWSIDPFGHSPTMAYLLKRMNFENMLIQRTHYEVKKRLSKEKSLEFFWRQNWDRRASTDILCHMMPFYSYDVPHTCGPDPEVCCQFDFARYPVNRVVRCPWGTNPKKINEFNVAQSAGLILDQWRKKSLLYSTNVVLIPLGDDFRYWMPAEAESQFSNYEQIFQYINSHPELKAKARFGTLNDYFTAARKELSARNTDKDASTWDPEFPTLSGDFFTYADVRDDYWSGYYTTRPFYKAMDRVLESTLRGTEILITLASAFNPRNRTLTPYSYPNRYAQQLLHCRRSLALFQHHDGVTGTARTHVVQDYARRMHSSILLLNKIASDTISLLLDQNFISAGSEKTAKFGIFTNENVRSRDNALPNRNVLAMPTEGKIRRIVVYNSLEETVDQVVSILVDSFEFAVFDSNRKCVQCQFAPEFVPFSSGNTTGNTRLFWRATVPPFGLQTFFLVKGICPEPTYSHIYVGNCKPDFQCPYGFNCSFGSNLTDGEISISNDKIRLGFSPHTGLMNSWEFEQTQEKRQIIEELGSYETMSSGAYLFKPQGSFKQRVVPGGPIFVTKGPLVEEVHSEPKFNLLLNPMIRVSRLYRGDSVQSLSAEMFHRLDLNYMELAGQEIVVRYRTSLSTDTEASSSVFFSDLNGFQMARREHYKKLPIQGNFYPMPALSFLQSPCGLRFSVHTRQAVGVASLQSGSLEMMLDRRLSEDDGRGLNQVVNDNVPTETTFSLLLEQNTSLFSPLQNPSSAPFPSLLSHRVGAQLNYPLTILFGSPETSSAFGMDSVGLQGPIQSVNGLRTGFSPVSDPIPCDYHVVNFKVQRVLYEAVDREGEAPQANLILHRRAWDNHYTLGGGNEARCAVSLDGRLRIGKVFGDFSVQNVSEVPLNLLPQSSAKEASRKFTFGGGRGDKQERATKPSLVGLGTVQMEPMEIRAFKMDLFKVSDKLS